MDKKVVGTVVAVLVVVIGGYFAWGMSKDSNTEVNQDENGSSIEDINTRAEDGKKMSFGNFLKQGGAYTCTVSQYVGDVESKGTVYINGGNVRGEFSTSVSGVNMQNYFLVKDGYSYSWSSMMPSKGYKVAVNDSTGGSASAQYSWNSDAIGDYNCEAWNVDNSKFSLPSGTVFTEIKQ